MRQTFHILLSVTIIFTSCYRYKAVPQAAEAATRAEEYRDKGNMDHFCYLMSNPVQSSGKSLRYRAECTEKGLVKSNFTARRYYRDAATCGDTEAIKYLESVGEKVPSPQFVDGYEGLMPPQKKVLEQCGLDWEITPAGYISSPIAIPVAAVIFVGTIALIPVFFIVSGLAGGAPN